MCGEQSQLTRFRATHWGSPPRVRGTDIPASMDRRKNRITPACAGNSKFHDNCGQRVEDHPRVCGEQQADLD